MKPKCFFFGLGRHVKKIIKLFDGNTPEPLNSKTLSMASQASQASGT